MMRLVTTAFLSAALMLAKAGSEAMRWRTRAEMPATCGEAIEVPDRLAYSPPRIAEVMLPPGAATSGLRVRSGETPHAENSEAAGLGEARTMPEWVTVT